MQTMIDGRWLYVGHLKDTGTSVLDVSDPAQPKVVRQMPAPAHTVTPKVQLADGLLFVNYEQRTPVPAERHGIAIFDLSDPTAPRELSYFDTGGRGVHRAWFDGGQYAYLAAWPDGFSGQMLIILDVSDPSHPFEAGRWWIPGTWTAGGESLHLPPGVSYKIHHPIILGDRAYVGAWDAGLFILDISDRAHPKTISQLSWLGEGSCTHTTQPLPGRKLLVTTDEAVVDFCADAPKRIRVIDIADERNPRIVGICPPPEGDYCERGGWSGPHNLHEHRQGTFRSEQIVFATYFNAGLRVYDIADPAAPREIAYFVPDPPPGQRFMQFNDLVVDERGLVYATDRLDGGLYVIEVD
jgi:hypothetical protein